MFPNDTFETLTTKYLSAMLLVWFVGMLVG